MSRSYSTFREQKPFADGWKEATHSVMAPSDHVHRPFVLESEGKQMPILRYASGSNGETYVMKAEIIEHSIVPAPDYVPKYSYRFQPWEEFRDFGDENEHHYHNPDQIFQNFIKKVQDEACRLSNTSVHPPLINSWRPGFNRPIVQENNRIHDDERSFRRDDQKNPNWERHNEPYLTDYKVTNTHPVPVMMGNNRIVPENNRKYDDGRNFRRDDPKKLDDSPNRERHNEPYLTDYKGTNTHPVPVMMGNNRIVPENNRKYDDGRNFRRDDPKKLDDSPSRERHNEPYLTDYKGTNTHPVPVMMGNNRIVPENNRKYDDGRNFRRDDPKKLDDSPNRERHIEPYLTNYKGTNTHPVMMGNNRIVPENNGKYDDGRNFRRDDPMTLDDSKEASRPPATNFPLPIANWRTGIKMPGPADTKVKPKDYDSEEEEEESRNPLGKFNVLKIGNNRGGEKPLDRYVIPKQFGQTAGGKKKNSEKIDSREASRRYGKLPSQPTKEEDYEGKITSKEAMAKYKGALVPPTGTRTTNTRINKN